MALRSSWAVDTAIDEEEARVALAALLMPGLRDPGTYPDQPSGRGGLRPGYCGPGTPAVAPGTVTFTGTQQLTVQPFQLILPPRRAPTAGGVYIITSDEPVVVDLLLSTPAHGSLTRYDRLIVFQTNTFYPPDVTTDVRIMHIPGVPSTSPTVTDPSTNPIVGDADWFELHRWAVPGGTTNLLTVPPIAAGVFPETADKYTVAAGGILPTSTKGRDALTARGWAGLTIYNFQTQVHEVLSGPGGTWKRLVSGAPVLQATVISPVSSLPVQVDGTLYMFNNELYLFRAPGTLIRLTYTNVTGSRANWVPIDYSTITRAEDTGEGPATRLVGPYTVQMAGAIKHVTANKNFKYGDLIGVVKAPFRPARDLRLVCVTELGSTNKDGADSTSAKITIKGDGTGHIYYYCPSGHHARWIGFDGITYQLDKQVWPT